MGGLDRRALPHAAACASPARYAKEPPLPANSRWIMARCLPNRCATAAALNPAADIASILTRSSKHKRRAILKTSTGRLLTELTGHHGRSVATTGRVRRPYRDRSVEENLDLFARMRAGEFADGEKVLRAKIDMTHDNMAMRDPVMYRIRNAHHFRTGDEWKIYPTYDWAHGQSDAVEGTTHSLCTLEFDTHRPLYDWFIEHLGLGSDHPRQTEFARLNLTHTVLSKRKLLELVRDGHVDGWDDPRMPTLRGLRRRGYPPEAIRAFCSHIGVARVNGTHEIELLESFVRTHHNRHALRRMAVLDPVELVIDNWPEGVIDERPAVNNPEDESAGTRAVPLGGRLWIERGDFMLDPPKKFFRLAPGREVRLRAGYLITCTDVETDANGEVVRIHCLYDPETAGGQAPDGRKVKATIHWVSAEHAT